MNKLILSKDILGIKKLLDNDKNLANTIMDNLYDYPLTLAVSINDVEIVKIFIEYGSRLDILDNDGYSILRNPIRYDNMEMIDLLIFYNKKSIGIDILTIRDSNDQTPINYCILFNRFDVIQNYMTEFLNNKLLLEYYISIKNNNQKILLLLINGINNNIGNILDSVFLKIFTFKPYDIEIFKILYDHFYDIFDFVCISNIIQLNDIQYLSIINSNKNINKSVLLDQDYYGNTLIHNVIPMGIRNIKMVLEWYKDDVEILSNVLKLWNEYGDTVLHSMLFELDIRDVINISEKYLLFERSNLDQINNDCITVNQMLVNKGEINYRNSNCKTYIYEPFKYINRLTDLDSIVGYEYCINAAMLDNKSDITIKFFAGTNKLQLDSYNFMLSNGILINKKRFVSNFDIKWYNSNLFYPNDLLHNIQEMLNTNNNSCIIIPLSIMKDKYAHSNVIILRYLDTSTIKESVINIERFEPYGKCYPKNFDYEPDKLDNILFEYFNTLKYDIKYSRPKDYEPMVGIQHLYDIIVETSKNKCGNCMIICQYYVQRYLTNIINDLNIDSKKNIELLIAELRTNNNWKYVFDKLSYEISIYRDKKYNYLEYLNDGII